MNKITEEKIRIGLDEAYKKAGHNAYFANGFEAGVKFAEEQFEILHKHFVTNSAIEIKPISAELSPRMKTIFAEIKEAQENFNKAAHNLLRLPPEHFK